ncbi:hypothetical protein QJQ45_028166 [Haematococcus lacustris]|nr:hypothetical protein QJQ45_028166 [Haematococcus lacustris]
MPARPSTLVHTSQQLHTPPVAQRIKCPQTWARLPSVPPRPSAPQSRLQQGSDAEPVSLNSRHSDTKDAELAHSHVDEMAPDFPTSPATPEEDIPVIAATLTDYLHAADALELSYAALLADLSNVAYGIESLTAEALVEQHGLSLVCSSSSAVQGPMTREAWFTQLKQQRSSRPLPLALPLLTAAGSTTSAQSQTPPAPLPAGPPAPSPLAASSAPPPPLTRPMPGSTAQTPSPLQPCCGATSSAVAGVTAAAGATLPTTPPDLPSARPLSAVCPAAVLSTLQWVAEEGAEAEAQEEAGHQGGRPREAETVAGGPGLGTAAAGAACSPAGRGHRLSLPGGSPLLTPSISMVSLSSIDDTMFTATLDGPLDSCLYHYPLISFIPSPPASQGGAAPDPPAPALPAPALPAQPVSSPGSGPLGGVVGGAVAAMLDQAQGVAGGCGGGAGDSSLPPPFTAAAAAVHVEVMEGSEKVMAGGEEAAAAAGQPGLAVEVGGGGEEGRALSPQATAVTSRSAPPAPWFACDDPASHTRLIVIQGSTSLDHWRINTQFEPVLFEDPALGVRVHRGVYQAALQMYPDMVPLVRSHLATSPGAKVTLTGHSLGGSLATLLQVPAASDRGQGVEQWGRQGGGQEKWEEGCGEVGMRHVRLADGKAGRTRSSQTLQHQPSHLSVNACDAHHLLLQLLLVHRGELPAACAAPLFTFGTPAIFCGGAGADAPPNPCSSCSLPCPEHHHYQDHPPPNSSSSSQGSAHHPATAMATLTQRSASLPWPGPPAATATAAAAAPATPLGVGAPPHPIGPAPSSSLPNPSSTSRSSCPSPRSPGLLAALGLPSAHITNVIMHRDIVPRAFACDYTSVAGLLQRLMPAFKGHSSLQGPAHTHKSLYSFLGRVSVLRPSPACAFAYDADEGMGHLPLTPGLYHMAAPLPAPLPPPPSTLEAPPHSNHNPAKALSIREEVPAAPPGGSSSSSLAGFLPLRLLTPAGDFDFHDLLEDALAAHIASHPDLQPCAASDPAPPPPPALSSPLLVGKEAGWLAGVGKTPEVNAGQSGRSVGQRAGGPASGKTGAVSKAGKAGSSSSSSTGAALCGPSSLRDAVLQVLNTPHPLTTLGEVSAYGPNGTISR